jgi:hypothetical protein
VQNASVSDFPGHLVQAPVRPRPRRGRAAGTDQAVGDVTRVNWNRPHHTERLEQGAGQFRDAALDVTRR